ncbi:MAG: hypothetical protein OIF47_04705 [Marinibacterium sp.]|nr:hypothetical protein [Marinibacterium sp.]
MKPMIIAVAAASALTGLAGCVDDITHVTKIEHNLNVDGQTYVIERWISTEQILDDDTAPQFVAVVGDQRVACNSTKASACAPAIRNARAAQALAAAEN